MSDRRKILDRIRALQSKTTDNGCTEAEAMAAAEVIAKLMAKYKLTDEEIEAGAIEAIDGEMLAREFYKEMEFVVGAIGYFCDCVVYETRKTVERSGFQHSLFDDPYFEQFETVTVFVFVGTDADVEIAEYIAAICQNAMKTAANRFAVQRGGLTGYALSGFLRGMASSMANTLVRLKDENGGPNEAKKRLAEKHLKEQGIRLQKESASRSTFDREAFHAGKQAGENVAFNPGVRSGGRAGAIGETLRIGAI